MIKILHLTSTRYGIGGVEKLLLDMSDKYDAEIFDVSYCNLFCDTGGKGAFPSELRKRGFRLHAIKGNRFRDLPLMLMGLTKLMRTEQFDVVHLHMLQATIIGGIAAKLAGLKTVVSKHYTPGPSHSGSGRARARRLLQRLDTYITTAADQVVAVSEYVHRSLVQETVPANKIVVIYNGIDIESFDRQSHVENVGSVTRQGFTIATVGSLTRLKSQRTLIEAFAKTVKESPSCRLLIIGEGPELGALQERSKRLGVDDKIRFLGFRQDIPSILASVDIYGQPSLFESFGLVLLEAMAARKPVVATAVGGMPEIVDPGVTGFLVPPDDPAEMALAIRRLLTDEGLRMEMGKNGREVVSEKFSIERTVLAYQELYRHLCTR